MRFLEMPWELQYQVWQMASTKALKAVPRWRRPFVVERAIGFSKLTFQASLTSVKKVLEATASASRAGRRVPPPRRFVFHSLQVSPREFLAAQHGSTTSCYSNWGQGNGQVDRRTCTVGGLRLSSSFSRMAIEPSLVGSKRL